MNQDDHTDGFDDFESFLLHDVAAPGHHDGATASTAAASCAEAADVIAAMNPMAVIEQHLRDLHRASEQATRQLVGLEEELERRNYERALHERQCEDAAAEIGQLRDALAEAQDQMAGWREASGKADSLAITLEYERHLHDLQCSLASERIRELEQVVEAQAQVEPPINPELVARLAQLEQELSLQTEACSAQQRQCEEAGRTIEHLTHELEQAKAEIEAARAAAAAATADGASDSHCSGEPGAGVPEGHVVVARTDIEQRDKAINLLKKHITSLREELQKSHDTFHGQQQQIQNLQQQLNDAVEKARRTAEPANEQRSRDAAGGADQRRRQVTGAEIGSQLAAVRAERQAVLEAKHILEEAEQRLIRKWAPGKAATRLFWALMTLGVLAASSYFGVMVFVPALYEATATISVGPKPGSELSGDQTMAWQTVHERLALDGAVIKATADRLRQRGLEGYASPEELEPLLKERLLVSSPEPGTLQLSLSVKGTGQAQRILDTYTQAFLGQSKAAQHLRTDGGITKIVVPAMTNPIPLDEQRQLLYALGCFAGSLILCTIVGSIITRRLRKSTGILSRLSDDDLFDTGPTTADWDTSRLSDTNVIA